ncbi:hypothetical protein QFZ65_003353 [Arthrobacter sp. B3I9]|uniref:hypothetical protein n=1 Tax=Arthrobacter sp. B3I9 TaxID=3042270 RepID=UPI0027939519|nr:hypothetical protein [Arthrobacter sp. B3I9]MDQ0851415.1 hypothetical protein [Arthrobacter sp. B3I9]
MRRIGSFCRALSASVCAAALLVACAPQQTAPEATAPPATASSASATQGTSGTATPASPSEPASGDWKNYTTTDGQLAFNYPAEWTVRDRAAEAAPGGVFVEVLADTGKSIATLRTNMVTGAECTEKYPYSRIDSEDLPALEQAGQTPRFVFEGRTIASASDPAQSNPLAYGITSAPEPSGSTACPIFHFFTWPPSGAMFGGAYNPFDTTPGNPPNVDTPQAYTETAEYKDLRKMITSLRPAGK